MTMKLSKSIEKNLEIFQQKIFHDDDVIRYRRFTLGNTQIKCGIIFIDSMIDKDYLGENVISPLTRCKSESIHLREIYPSIENIIAVESLRISKGLEQMIEGILYGDALLLIDGTDLGMILSVKGWEYRSISEPTSESVVRGSREGFTESIIINISLLRRKIQDSRLKFKMQELGRRTKTKIAICYIEDLVSPQILQEVFERINKIDIDGILESGYIEELIKDSPLSPFKTVGHTERPDILAGKILEGRVGILCDGTPFVLTVPFIFMEGFQSNEDYYRNWALASLDRMLRYVGFFITTSTPAIYLSLITYHQEMIPTPLLLSISAAREGIPFPTIFELIVLGLVFEILREGGVRLPSPIGQALSIVGAIVLGDAAVTANFVSAPMIIVIALTGISSFVIPQFLGVVILIRLAFVLFASVLGLYGFVFAVIGLFIHLMSIRSFGIPYMTELSSYKLEDVKDTVIRAPWWWMQRRPKLITKKNRPKRKRIEGK